MNYTTPTFVLRVTHTESRTFTPEIIALLIPAIQHAIKTDTKRHEAPNLGERGIELIKAFRGLYGLSLYDAVRNVRRLVHDFEVHDFEPPHDWTDDRAAAQRVLDQLHDKGCISEWDRNDLINDMYRVCK
jgi:hypothetical protein